MVKKVQITGDLTFTTVDKRVATSAAKAACINATDKKDALLLLDMLGLIPPQAGYLPYESTESKAQRKEARRLQFKEVRDQQAETRRAEKALEGKRYIQDQLSSSVES